MKSAQSFIIVSCGLPGGSDRASDSCAAESACNMSLTPVPPQGHLFWQFWHTRLAPNPGSVALNYWCILTTMVSRHNWNNFFKNKKEPGAWLAPRRHQPKQNAPKRVRKWWLQATNISAAVTNFSASSASLRPAGVNWGVQGWCPYRVPDLGMHM